MLEYYIYKSILSAYVIYIYQTIYYQYIYLPIICLYIYIIFFCLVVPQPVYMNQEDLNAMAANLAKTAEELKTPTAEDLGGVEAAANEMTDGGYCNG